MDEKNKQKLTLDDILNQLTKPSVILGQDAGRQASIPPPLSSSQPSLRVPTSGEVKLPSLGNEVKSSSTPGTIPSPAGSQQSSISLSLRTMALDIDRLKKGQGPTSFEVKKTVQLPKQLSPAVTPVAPKENSVEVNERISMATPLAPTRPTLPIRPTIRFPQPATLTPPTQKQTSSILPQISREKPATEQTIDNYNRERIASKSNEALPGYLGASVPKKIAESPKEVLEYRALAKVIGSGMTAGIIITVIIAITAYFLLSFFVFNEEELAPLPSPTPISTPQITQTPESSELESIFRDVISINFSLPINKVDTATNLKSFIKETEINQSEFKKINFISTDSQTIALTFIELLDRLSIRYPVSLGEVIKGDNMTFMYGQEEILGGTDSLPDSSLANKKVVLIVELKDITRAKEILREWELTMSEDLKNMFNIEPNRAETPEFNNNEYGGASIRYRNFPLPDRSIDYAIVHSLIGRQYLLLTNSRESMYSPVEKIIGL